MHKKSDDLLRKPPNLVEVPPGFGPGNEGFADLCLTTWLWYRKHWAHTLIDKMYACNGAVDEARTRDLHLGKVALYQLSYYRIQMVRAKRLELIRLSAPDPNSGASAIPPRPPIYRQKW